MRKNTTAEENVFVGLNILAAGLTIRAKNNTLVAREILGLMSWPLSDTGPLVIIRRKVPASRSYSQYSGGLEGRLHPRLQ